MKIDLHIHSAFSEHKDKNKEYLKSNTIENLPVLIKRLNNNKVNICAISDHDVFSYELYRTLKKEENKGTIKKVLPAVEFSVLIKRNNKEKQIHVVTIFDDSDDDKIKQIEGVLKLVNKKPKYDKDSSFSEIKFLQILAEIGLNTVCIAHQKNTLTSGKIRKNDVNSLGEDVFNEFLFAEYFEAYEFKNKKHELFNNISKSKLSEDLLRFITGSDCHDWRVYPKYNSDEADDMFLFTYLKCLPTFKGVALGMTDNTRISLHNNFFNQTNKVLKKLSFEIKGQKIDVPMSRGINVVIGDNSVGKSLLVHKLTNYYRGRVKQNLSPLNSAVIRGYNEYLEKNNIILKSKLEQKDIFEFDTQGEIRRKFNLKMLKQDEFFKDKYPSDVNTITIKKYLESKVDNFISTLKNDFTHDQNMTGLLNLKLLNIEEKADILTFTKMDDGSFKANQTKAKSIIAKFDEVKVKLTELKALLKDKNDTAAIAKMIKEIKDLKKTYTENEIKISNNLKVINCLNIALEGKADFYTNIKSKNDRVIQEYANKKTGFITNIITALKSLSQKSEIDLSMEEQVIEPEVLNYLEFEFVKKTKVMTYDTSYLGKLVRRPLKQNYNTDFNNLSEDKLTLRLKQFDGSIAPLDYYKNKLYEEIADDLKSVESIVISKGDTKEEYSAGLNVRIYFRILSSQNAKNGIYIIDQPEDDISPRAIKEFVLDDFKKMSQHRQIIIVTHNPQFVVNLDVDNVIHIDKEDEKILIQSGALEYEDENYKILDIVANSLEGGVETIRKRWKRYEKNISSAVEW